MSIPRFKEVVVVDNFLRSSDNALHSHPNNRRFLFETFRQPARRLGLRCSELAARSDGGSLDVAAMMDALGLDHTPAGWARSCSIDLAPLVATGLLRRFDLDTLVIGWGMPPSLLHLIDRQGACFIDLEIAPVRFGAHLAFCARTNDRQIEAALGQWAIDDESHWNEAGILRGYFARRGVPQLFGHGLSVGLFCGQTAVDLALVSRGKIARPIDVEAHVRKLAASVDLLVIKAHPYESDARHLTQLAARLPNAAWTDANIYALLCADNVEFVCGLSSGALHEASYFMKEALPLILPDRNNPKCLPADCSEWLSVGPGIASLHAMAAFCAWDRTQPPTGPAVAFPQDALDRAFDIRWGLDAHSTGLRELPLLVPGEDHEFHVGCPAAAWLSAGWSAPDGAGAWAAAERACIVIPLAEGTLPEAAPLAVRVNGSTHRDADAGYRLSVRVAGAQKSRALVLDFHFTQPRRFLLQQLSVRALAQPRASASGSRPKAGLARTVSTVAVICAFALIAAASALLPATSGGPTVQAAELNPDTASASNWSQIKRTMVTHMEEVRDDLEHLLQQRHGQASAPMSSRT